MESLSEKYLKLLSEYEELLKKFKNLPPPQEASSQDTNCEQCEQRVQNCSNAYSTLYDANRQLVQEITKLYKMGVPPRISSFFSTIIPWIKNGFKVSTSAEDRISMCKKCDLFINDTTCQACGCYMIAKTKIPQAYCPVGKWKAEKPKED
jgi:hypothetical protein|tara:strand:+ start:951 stop:1400 length:450 start_codon:yes stop_codon:yes gene_type:complete